MKKKNTQILDFSKIKKENMGEKEGQQPDKKINRNSPCPCGSGKKYKKCCLPKYEKAIKQTREDSAIKNEQDKAEMERQEIISKAFALIREGDYKKAVFVATTSITGYKSDDRFFDIMFFAYLGLRDYKSAIKLTEERFDVAVQEKSFFIENNCHRNQKVDPNAFCFFYKPDNWLKKKWMAVKSSEYLEMKNNDNNEFAFQLVEELKKANDMELFPQQQQEGYKKRRDALADAVEKLKEMGDTALPQFMELSIDVNWASLFIPELLSACDLKTSVEYFMEIALFGNPFITEESLKSLEKMGDSIVEIINDFIFMHDEYAVIKTPILAVLGNIGSDRAFSILEKVLEHKEDVLVNDAGWILGKVGRKASLPLIKKADDRLNGAHKLTWAIEQLS